MSYDIYIGSESFNITYNVSIMFYAHNKKGIRFIYGKTGDEAIPLLADMIGFFFHRRKFLEGFNPENSWGSWEDTTKKLIKMLWASSENPDKEWSGD